MLVQFGEAVRVAARAVPDSERTRSEETLSHERQERKDVLTGSAVSESPAAAAVAVRSDADIVTARQEGRALALKLGFAPTEATLVATAISELARNVILYAQYGEIYLSALEEHGRRGILVRAVDEGPGIANVSRVMAGGHSTSGGLGLGLCGVRRLMDEFEIASRIGHGTTVTAKKWKG